MGKLTISPRLSAEERDLLEAAGFDDDRDLTRVGPERIQEELAKANEFLEIMDETPTLETVEGWVAELKPREKPAATEPAAAPAGKAAKRAAGRRPATTAKKTQKKAAKKPSRKTAKKAAQDDAPRSVVAEGETPSAAPNSPPAPIGEPPSSQPPEFAPETSPGCFNYELDPDVQDMLARAPVALPIPNRQLAEKQIPPAEISAAALLTAAPGDLEVRVTAHSPTSTRAEPNTPKSRIGGLVKVAESRRNQRREIDMSRVRTMDDARREPATAPEPAEPSAKTPELSAQHERVRLLRTARESTNRGKDPNSRRYVRGVLHDRPVLVTFGCIILVLFQLGIAAAIVGSPLLILADFYPETFPAIPSWFLIFPLSVPALGVLYLTISTQVKCRVCGQRVLWPKHCRKHVKAHHVRGLGHILPLALHTLTFRWFTCTFCGTAVRIKK